LHEGSKLGGLEGDKEGSLSIAQKSNAHQRIWVGGIDGKENVFWKSTHGKLGKLTGGPL